MEKASFDRREHPRHQAQQQPQQHIRAGMPASSRKMPPMDRQALSNAQARKQSGKL